MKNKRFKVVVMMMVVWLILGLYAIHENRVSEVTELFKNLALLVGTFVVGDSIRGSNDVTR